MGTLRRNIGGNHYKSIISVHGTENLEEFGFTGRKCREYVQSTIIDRSNRLTDRTAVCKLETAVLYVLEE